MTALPHGLNEVTLYFEDNHIKIYNSDCRHMSELADNPIQCCVTSPPYWGLRKYKAPDITFSDGWKGQFGLEPTIELYIAHTIEILREIKRVLRPDGVCFWNIGDSYNGNKQGNTETTKNPNVVYNDFSKHSQKGIKPKDLCLIPFRVALAAQSDGWWVRSDIIWNKPNPMPESVTDRPTDAYEHIFMFTKSARYYWDSDAVKEPALPDSYRTDRPMTSGAMAQADHFTGGQPQGRTCGVGANGRNLRNVWTFPTQPYKGAHFATFPEALPEKCIKAASKEGDIVLDPFAGSGTTLWVAKKLNRRAVGYEISEQYCKLARNRNAQTCAAWTE
jgi:DNA modification methylase